MNFTVNKPRVVTYIANLFTTGLTDLVLAVRQPDGTPVSPAPTVVEQGAGVYTATYTPTQVGVHQELISSVTNGDKVFKAVAIEAVDTSDIKSDIDSSTTSIESAVTTVGTAVTANGTAIAAVQSDLDASVTAIEAAVSTVKSDVDSSTTAVQASIAAVQSTVNSIAASESKSGGYFA